jgi:hypothetical protein
MTASDRRARGGGVLDTLAKANGSVLAAQWGEAAKEHGGGVGVGGVWVEMEVPRVCGEVARMGKSPPRK